MNLKRLSVLVLMLALVSVLASAVSPATGSLPRVAANGAPNPTERSFAIGGGLVQTVELLMASDVPAAEADRIADSFFGDRFGGGTVLDYVTTGDRWPASSMPVPIFYNQNVAGEPSLKDAMDFSVARWNTTPGSTYRLVSGGATTALAGLCGSPTVSDHQNTLAFGDTGNSSVLGLTCVKASASHEILEADIIFNSTVLFSSAAVTPNNAFDFTSVVLHELGHFGGLNHPCQTGSCAGVDSIMVPTVDHGQQRRTPRPDDVMGLNSIYPASRSVLPFKTYAPVVVGDSPR